MRPYLMFAIVALYSRCYAPNMDLVRISCEGDGGACPSGKTCLSGLCQDPPDLSMGQLDASTAEMSSSDLATNTICANLGQVSFGAKAAGCPGTFPKGGAAGQCKSPAAPCISASGIDLTKCNSAPGFFTSSQPGYWLGTMASEACGAAASNQILYGCGSSGRAGVAACGSFGRVIDLGTSLKSNTGQLADASNSDPLQGVLCCLP